MAYCAASLALHFARDGNPGNRLLPASRDDVVRQLCVLRQWRQSYTSIFDRARPEPAIDFGYHYGLLPILVGRIWFAVAGLTPIAYQILTVIFDLAIVSAVARIAAHLRFNATSLALTAITLGFAVRASYPSLAQGLEAVLLSSALADQSSGKHRRALIMASAAAFAKPSMGYLYAVVLIVFACRNLRGERLVSRALYAIAPAFLSSLMIAIILATFYTPTALIKTILPLKGATAYRILHYGFFNEAGLPFGIQRAHRGSSTWSMFRGSGSSARCFLSVQAERQFFLTFATTAQG